MSARVPSYQLSIAFNSDKRAMYDILRRIRCMFGVEIDLSDLEKESNQQIRDFENALKKLCIDSPEQEQQITAYMDHVRDSFKEVRFVEPTKIPDVFLKGFDTPRYLSR